MVEHVGCDLVGAHPRHRELRAGMRTLLAGSGFACCPGRFGVAAFAGAGRCRAGTARRWRSMGRHSSKRQCENCDERRTKRVFQSGKSHKRPRRVNLFYDAAKPAKRDSLSNRRCLVLHRFDQFLGASSSLLSSKRDEWRRRPNRFPLSGPKIPCSGINRLLRRLMGDAQTFDYCRFIPFNQGWHSPCITRGLSFAQLVLPS